MTDKRTYKDLLSEDGLEDLIIKKIAFDKLSEDAKEVLYILMHAPREIMQVIATPKGRIYRGERDRSNAKAKLESYFKNVFKIDGERIKKTFDEITIFIKEHL